MIETTEVMEEMDLMIEGLENQLDLVEDFKYHCGYNESEARKSANNVMEDYQ